MGKIGIIGDVHWCTNSSIIRSRGKDFSTRLENLIKSVNWAEEQCTENGCEIIIYLGDFFDRSDLTAEEISALTELKWSDIRHIFLLGNHEIYNSLFSSLNIFKNTNFEIINSPREIYFNEGLLCVLPYIQKDHKTLKEYFPNITKQSIIFSHNDIKGLQYGHYKSEVGIDIEDIKETCGLFFNGHLHNVSKIADNAFNVGNLTGQNFSEDASLYSHGIFIYDTSVKQMDYFENPFAFNFYHLTSTQGIEILKDNAVITVNCNYDDYDQVIEQIKNCKKIVESRIITLSNNNQKQTVTTKYINYYDLFREFVLSFDNSELTKKELEEVFKR